MARISGFARPKSGAEVASSRLEHEDAKTARLMRRIRRSSQQKLQLKPCTFSALSLPVTKVSLGPTDAGLSVWGRCTSCRQQEWIPLGFKTFNINRVARDTLCPKCGGPVEKVSKLRLSSCLYSIQGASTDAGKFEIRSGEVARDRILSFKSKKTKEWVWLEVDVKKDGSLGARRRQLKGTHKQRRTKRRK